MSTKIYTGFKLPQMSAQHLLDFCIVFREKAIIKRNEIIKRVFREDYYREKYWDLTMRANKVKKTMARDPIVDYSFELSLFPMKDKILGITFGDSGDLEKFFREQELVEDYYYQDQTDDFVEVSKDEWKQRKEDWEIALPGAGVPSHCSFCFTVLGYDLPTPDKIWGGKE